MHTKFLKKDNIVFEKHPKYTGVRIAKLITLQEAGPIGVSILEIATDTTIPVHTHAPNIDSIYILAGNGEAFLNGVWQPIEHGDYIFAPALEEHGIKNTGKGLLKLFVVHSPPLF